MSTDTVTTSTSGSGSGSTEQPGTSYNKPLRSGSVLPAIRSAPSARDVHAEREKYIRLVLRIVTVVLREERSTCLSDLVEAVKCRCARAQIPYGRGEVIAAALSRLDRDRRLVFAVPVTPPAPDVRDVRPLTRAEARYFLDELGVQPLVKSMRAR